MIGKEFFYEGTVTRKPFFAQISYDGPPFHKGTDINLLWNRVISIFVWSIGTITLMYRALPSMKIIILIFLSEKAQWNAVYWNRERRKMAKDSINIENCKLLDISETEQRSEGRFTFLEKYAKYPNVIRVMLARDLRTKYPIGEPEPLNIYALSI